MSRHPYQTPEAHEVLSGAAMRAPLRDLSCPYNDRDVVGHQPEQLLHYGSVRSFARNEREASRRCSGGDADLSTRCHSLAAGYWNPPTTGRQQARQRILAVIVAFMLAAALAHVGW